MKCSSGTCKQEASITVDFTSGRKLRYCAKCARRITGPAVERLNAIRGEKVVEVEAPARETR